MFGMGIRKTFVKNVIDMKYEFLNRMVIKIHSEHQAGLSESTLEEIRSFEQIAFYDRERMLTISESGNVQEEMEQLVRSVLTEREKCPDGSNTECIAIDRLTEFLSKLDLEDFRKVRIQGLLTNQAEDAGGKRD
jgi:hypothetical protein